MSDEPEQTLPPAGSDDETVIDWEQIRKRLKRLRATTSQSGPSGAAKTKVLRERAAVLAKAPEHEDVEGDVLELLEFALGDERYAIDSAAVREVYALKEITPVPGTPQFILGVVGVRGRIVSVVDIGRLFDSPPRDAAAFTKAIVLKSSAMEFGILADEVEGMCWVPVSQLQSSLPTLTGARKKYLRGVTTDRIAVLDAQRLLSDEGLVVRQERGGVR